MRPDARLIEERFKESIDAWVKDGREPGSFIWAVLENNLSEAIGRGDEAAIANLQHIVSYLYNDCPMACWGSPEKVKEWATWIVDPENQDVIARTRKVAP